MLKVLRDTWALLGGLMLLMIGNGMQGTLLGVRGAIEGFDTFTLSMVMSAYFIGFMFSAGLTPRLIAAVGHVRVFAALGSVISACFLLYAALPNPVVWFLMRVLVGFGYCGIYIVVESWLNDMSTNETRGKALSAYIIVQTLGIVASQAIANVAPIEGYTLFVIISVLVSVSFLPILLTAVPTPVYQVTRPMSLRRLYRTSPLAFVAAFLLGSVFSSVFAMLAVFGTMLGYSVERITVMTGAIYGIGLVVQYPIGWVSDRMDRRRLILAVSLLGAVGGAAGALLLDWYWAVVVAGALVGGLASPMWGLIVAHVNDFTDHRDMPAASGGLLFVNGLGAIGGPVALGWLMNAFGPWMFFGFNTALMGAIALYALWRMSRRAAPAAQEAAPLAPVLFQAAPVALAAGRKEGEG